MVIFSISRMCYVDIVEEKLEELINNIVYNNQVNVELFIQTFMNLLNGADSSSI